MRPSTLGFGLCALGCFLHAVNFLGAAIVTRDVAQWRTDQQGGRIQVAYDWVGFGPTDLGAALFLAGAALLARPWLKARRDAKSSAHASGANTGA